MWKSIYQTQCWCLVLALVLLVWIPMHQSFFIGNRLSHRADLFKKVSTDASRRRDGLRRYSSSSDLGRQSPVPKIDSKTNRRKMGPPQRKFGYQPPLEQTPTVGRVSVYCVGSALDLEALRVHVFRKGFGGDENKNDFHLSKGAEDQDVIDDEVLHVTNGPSSFEKSRQDDGEEGTGSSVLENSDEVSWKTKVMVGMATQDIFYFEYGCVVFWGLSLAEEKAAISELMQFTIDPVTSEQLEDSHDTMEYEFDKSANPQRPVRFDRMKLRSLRMAEKLSLSYAMAQSSKLFVFESNVLLSVERTRFLPRELAKEGQIRCSKKELNMLIGQLFVEQTEVNLFSSILDTPDFLWDDDEFVPVYQYTRSYLEVDDRVALLNSRLAVIRELLDVLTAQVANNNSTRLEWIIIWLITVETTIGIATNPLFEGYRIFAMVLVPTAILLYSRYRS